MKHRPPYIVSSPVIVNVSCGALKLFCDGWKLETVQKHCSGQVGALSSVGVYKVKLLCIKLGIHFVKEAYHVAPCNYGAVSPGGRGRGGKPSPEPGVPTAVKIREQGTAIASTVAVECSITAYSKGGRMYAYHLRLCPI
jgi:hypothetical protein